MLFLVFCTHQNKQDRQCAKAWQPKLIGISTTQTRIQLSLPHTIINLTTQFKWGGRGFLVKTGEITSASYLNLTPTHSLKASLYIRGSNL